ncbi:MAG: hypothetical protein DVB22_001903 [Verrucomicrobia bacterium]|nr:MAG: hypothetical protein DVB22_001903 [Verrucomicrobiota bacterium]
MSFICRPLQCPHIPHVVGERHMHFRAASAVRVTLRCPRLHPCHAPNSTATHPVSPGIQTCPHIRTPHARPLPAVECTIGIELRDHYELQISRILSSLLHNVNPARQLPLHWEPAEKPGPLARRAILPHGEAQRCHVEKGPPPGGESVPNPQRSRMLPDQHLSFR